MRRFVVAAVADLVDASPLRRLLPVVALLGALGSVAGSAPAGMNEAGVRAATERRFCDASAIFVQVHGLSRDPLALYRAAETTFAAGDYLAAIRLYRTLLDNHPDFDRAVVVETRIGELLMRVKESGPGTACALPPRICGDWIISAGEGCDDGNIIDGDGCDATCMPTGCGNGNKTADEICDDGNADNGDGCDANCTISACGNGAVAPGEACDDGNTIEGDGCDSNCTISACGNGVRASGEACDDGNLENGDGCSSACTIEPPQKPFPVTMVGGGVAALALGTTAAIVGTLPLSAHAAAREQILAAEDLSPANPETAIARAEAAQNDQARAQADWSTWGVPSVVLGSVVATAGLGLTIGALAWWLTPADFPEEGAPDTASPASTTTTRARAPATAPAPVPAPAPAPAPTPTPPPPPAATTTPAPTNSETDEEVRP